MNKKIKGLNGLNNSVTYIVNKYTFADVKCFLSDEFAYYIKDDEINFSLYETERTSKTFMKFINSIGGKCDDDWDSFTYSILHEVGHYYTLNDMNDTIYKISHFLEKIIEKCYRKTNSDKIYSLYYYLPHEYIATKYAINFNPILFKGLKKELKREIERFYQKNLDNYKLK